MSHTSKGRWVTLCFSYLCHNFSIITSFFHSSVTSSWEHNRPLRSFPCLKHSLHNTWAFSHGSPLSFPNPGRGWAGGRGWGLRRSQKEGVRKVNKQFSFSSATKSNHLYPLAKYQAIYTGFLSTSLPSRDLPFCLLRTHKTEGRVDIFILFTALPPQSQFQTYFTVSKRKAKFRSQMELHGFFGWPNTCN